MSLFSKYNYLFIILVNTLIFYQKGFCQQALKESVAKNYMIKADTLYTHFIFDSSSANYLIAAEIFEDQKEWVSGVKCYRLAAHSFLLNSNIDTALYFIEKADSLAEMIFKNNSSEEITEKFEVLKCLGEIIEKSGPYSKSFENFKKAESLITDTLNDVRLPEIWNKIGKAYINLEKYDLASEILTKANLFLSDNDKRSKLLLAENLTFLGLLNRFLANYDSSLTCYKKALEIRKTYLTPDHYDIAQNYAQTGVVYEKLQEFNKALQYQFKALEIYKKIFGDDALILSDCYNDIAINYGKSTIYDKAIEYNLIALKIKKLYLRPDHIEIGRLYNNIAITYFYQGQYHKAIEYHEKALNIKKICLGSNSSDVATTYNNIGKSYELINNHEEAEKSYQNSLKINLGRLGDYHPEVARNYINLANLYIVKKDYSKANDYIQKSLNIRLKKFGLNNTGVGDCYNLLGVVFREKENLDSALHYFFRSLKLNQDIIGEKNGWTARDYLNIAHVYDQSGEYSKALEFFQKGLIANSFDFSDTSAFANPPSVYSFFSRSIGLTLLTGKAQCLFRLFEEEGNIGYAENSLSTYKLAFSMINRLRNDCSNEDTKLLLSDKTKSYFFKAVKVAYEYNRKLKNNTNEDLLFSFIEKSKSSVLSTLINETSGKFLADIPKDMITSESYLKNSFNICNTKILNEKIKKKGYDTSQVTLLENERFSLSMKLDSLIEFFENNYPAYFEFKYTDNTISVSDVQKILGKKSAILNYFTGDTSLFLIVITDSMKQIFEVNTGSTFKETVKDFYMRIKTAEASAFLSESQSLYNFLIRPAEKALAGKEHLIIVPDDYLYYLPFETLVNNTENTSVKNGDYSKISYLIKNYSVSYHQSATLWYNSTKKKKEQLLNDVKNFIGFAPVFNEKANNGLILSSNIQSIDSSDGQFSYRSVSKDMKNFNPLPYSEKEVVSIVKLFEKHRKEAVAYLYKEASEPNFKNNASGYSIVHISSHGFSNDQYPNLSGIAFSQPDSAEVSIIGNNDDGILYAGETYHFSLKNDLLVLSSCESGMGKLIKGEGLQALSRGFLYSGTPNIIFSLWKALDKPTKDLMVEFYTGILDGKSYSEALRSAKIKLISDPETSFPHFWSGFLLLGRN